jgi:hypothetical protein
MLRSLIIFERIRLRVKNYDVPPVPAPSILLRAKSKKVTPMWKLFVHNIMYNKLKGLYDEIFEPQIFPY